MSVKFRVQNFLTVIVQFLSSLEQRLKAYENTRYLFFCTLESTDCDKIEAAAGELVAEYKDDLNQTLGVELVQFLPSSLIFLKMIK